jgi:hypothetical protein
MRYVTASDVAECYWAHSCSPAQVFARVHSFPSGLPSDKATQAKEAAVASELRSGSVLGSTPQLEHVEVSVRRDGHLHRLPWPRVVEGDVVVLEAGDSVWGDVRVLEVTSARSALMVIPPDQMIEMLTVRQLTAEQEMEGTSFLAARNMVWAGSTVVRGSCVGVVVHALPRSLRQVFSSPLHGGIGADPFITSKRKLHLKTLWEQRFGLLLPDGKNMFRRLRKTPFTHIVLHWKSPLLAWRAEERPLVALRVLVGREMQEAVEGRDAALIGEVLQCCSVASSSWLSLEHMKEWNAGAMAIGDVGAQGPRRDPVGAALLRYALARLGAKQFWSHRQAGFRVYANGRKSTLAQLANVGYFWCGAEEASEACSHWMAGDGSKVAASSSFWASVRSKAATLRGQRVRNVALGKREGLASVDGTGALPVKSGVFLGLVAFNEAAQTREEVVEALATLRTALNVSVVLRGENEAGVVALSRELQLLPPDFAHETHVFREADTDDDAVRLGKMRSSPVWIVGNKGAALKRHTCKVTSIGEVRDPGAPPAPEADAEETAENTFEFPIEQGLRPWWQGLVPVDGPKELLWTPAPRVVNGRWTFRGESALMATSPGVAAQFTENGYASHMWVVDEEDDFRAQFQLMQPLTIVPPGVSNCAKTVAGVIMTHNSLLLLATGLLSMRHAKKPEDIAEEVPQPEWDSGKGKEEETESAVVSSGPNDNNAPVETVATVPEAVLPEAAPEAVPEIDNLQNNKKCVIC